MFQNLHQSIYHLHDARLLVINVYPTSTSVSLLLITMNTISFKIGDGCTKFKKQWYICRLLFYLPRDVISLAVLNFEICSFIFFRSFQLMNNGTKALFYIKKVFNFIIILTLSWRRPMPHRNQSSRLISSWKG